MNPPIAIDLFCGLASGQAEFCLGAYPSIEQFVARRAENPNHVRFGVLDLSERAVTSVFWPVCQFNYPAFAARLAGCRQVRMFAAKANHDTGILEFPAPVVDLLDCRIFSVEGSPGLLRRLTRTVVRAVAAIAIRWNDVEVRAAYSAIPPSTRDVALFVPAKASSTTAASDRTVSFVWAFRR